MQKKNVINFAVTPLGHFLLTRCFTLNSIRAKCSDSAEQLLGRSERVSNSFPVRYEKKIDVTPTPEHVRNLKFECLGHRSQALRIERNGTVPPILIPQNESGAQKRTG
jgi:hypothetical protein